MKRGFCNLDTRQCLSLTKGFLRLNKSKILPCLCEMETIFHSLLWSFYDCKMSSQKETSDFLTLKIYIKNLDRSKRIFLGGLPSQYEKRGTRKLFTLSILTTRTHSFIEMSTTGRWTFSKSSRCKRLKLESLQISTTIVTQKKLP